ncbi:hypothetical protein [Lacinutrix chionoecetis]
MKSFNYVLILLAILSFSACENDNNIPINENSEAGETNPFLQNFGNAIQARFVGTVVNEQNNPIAGVTINIGSQFTTTDANGVFSVLAATVYEKYAYIKATKAGYIDGSRAVVPSTGVNQVKIMLLGLDPVATIIAGQALTIDLPDGTEVELPGQFTNQFGGPYQGEVDVIIKHLSVDNEDMKYQMPGSLLAQNADGDLRIMETVGMIAVELRGENGEDLNIAPGEPATIKIPVGSSVTNPPATIPLWSFDEDNGYWVEDGIGELVGNKFVGEVSHFSFWNWDFQYPAVTVCITLQDTNGNPLPNTELDLYSPALNSTGMYGFTDNNGVECGLVPQDDTLTLVIPDYGCLDDDFTTTIGPFSEDESIVITVSIGSALTTNFTATFNDCNGAAITNGYLQLFYNGQPHIIPITNGMISQVIDYCSADTTFSAQAFDFTNGQSTTVFNGNFTSPTTDLGTEMSCVDLADTDGDGVFDFNEDINGNNNLDDDDTDGDSIPNYQDEDDDGDGINTADEDYDNDGNPMNDDTDNDGIPDYLDAFDNCVYETEIFTNGDCTNSYNLDAAYNSPNCPNVTYTFHETEADALANTNALISPYTNTSNLQQVFVSGTNTISNVSYVSNVYLLGNEFMDSDNDGLTDCEETTGVDDPATTANPNGVTSDPNDPCDPVATNLTDSDGDGLTDCEELTGVDNPSTPMDPAGATSDPNDPCDPVMCVNPIAENDVSLNNAVGTSVTILVTADNGNGQDFDANGTIIASTVSITTPGATDATGDGDNDTLVVAGEGTWTLDENANLTFTPEPGFTGDPTPVTYTVEDNDGNVSNQATVTITYN